MPHCLCTNKQYEVSTDVYSVNVFDALQVIEVNIVSVEGLVNNPLLLPQPVGYPPLS